MNAQHIISRLKSMANPANTAGISRFGINPHGTLGVSVTDLRKIAKECGRDHDPAAELWASGILETGILASMVDVPDLVTDEQMETWAADFDSWDVADRCCNNNKFRKTNSPQLP